MCGRPSCEAESVATLAIDPSVSAVVLSDPITSREGIPLCERHANATTAPVGWELIDNRVEKAPLEAVDQAKEQLRAVPSRPERRRETETSPADMVSKFPWQHEFSKEDTPKDLIADSPLLARAFRSSTAKSDKESK